MKAHFRWFAALLCLVLCLYVLVSTAAVTAMFSSPDVKYGTKTPEHGPIKPPVEPPKAPELPTKTPEQGPFAIKTLPIESFEVQMRELQPVEVAVLVIGQFPDSCTTFHEATQVRDGTTIDVTITVKRPNDNDMICVGGKPFKETITLEGDFPPGDYTVRVNNITQHFTILPTKTLEPGITIKTLPIDGFVVQPLQPGHVAVVVGGGLPDGCTKFHKATQVRDGTTIDVTITVMRPTNKVCASVVERYKETITLEGDFPPGNYTVRVNGITQRFTL